MTSLLTLLLVSGCSGPDPAPDDIDDLSRFLFRTFDDEAQRDAGVVALQAWLEDAGIAAMTPLDERAWALTPLEDRDLSTLEDHPGRDPEPVLGLGSSFVSAYGAACHARMHVASDQLPVEPGATKYVRRFPFDDDPTCFPERRCEEVHAVSEVRRENLVLSLDFVLHKVYRWMTIEGPDGELRDAIVARSWAEDAFEGSGGVLWQSYAADVWIDRPEGGSWRYQAHWSETEIHLPGDFDAIHLDLNKGATEDTMTTTDATLAALTPGCEEEG